MERFNSNTIEQNTWSLNIQVKSNQVKLNEVKWCEVEKNENGKGLQQMHNVKSIDLFVLSKYLFNDISV